MTDPVFVIAGEPRPRLELEWESSTDSAITGAPLRAVTVTTGLVSPDLLGAVRDDLRSSTVVDSDGRPWAVGTWSEQISNDQSSFTFSLKESETVDLLAVAFDSISLDAFNAHSVKATDRLIVVDITVDVDVATSEQIEEAIERAHESELAYFPVTLAGVRQEPVSMRFGRCVWRPLDDGRVRHRLVFVSEVGDDAKSQTGTRFNYPEVNRLIDSALASQARLDALLDELKAGGALTAEATARILSATPAPRAARVFDRDDELGEETGDDD